MDLAFSTPFDRGDDTALLPPPAPRDEGEKPIVIVGGGFTGLSAAHDLARAGRKVVVLEKDKAVGGLAGGFEVGGHPLEKFYHHWFTNDVHVMDLIRDIGCEDKVVYRPTRTG